MKMQDCRQCTTMTEHGEREASVCLPCAVHCTTTTECGCGDRDYLDAGRTRNHASRTRREGTFLLLLPRGCIPSSPAFLHRGENGHFLLIPHIPQKGSFDSLNLERHLTFRLSSPLGRFFPVFPDVLKGFPFFARSIIEPMFCVLQSRRLPESIHHIYFLHQYALFAHIAQQPFRPGLHLSGASSTSS